MYIYRYEFHHEGYLEMSLSRWPNLPTQGKFAYPASMNMPRRNSELGTACFVFAHVGPHLRMHTRHTLHSIERERRQIWHQNAIYPHGVLSPPYTRVLFFKSSCICMRSPRSSRRKHRRREAPIQ
jgi:hypothetical protein